MHTDHELRPQQPLRLEKAGRAVIECLHGTAWITAYAQLDDCVLRSGERYTVPNGGLVLVEAVGSGSIRVHGAAPTRRAWRRLLAWPAITSMNTRNTRNT